MANRRLKRDRMLLAMANVVMQMARDAKVDTSVLETRYYEFHEQVETDRGADITRSKR